MDMGNQHPSIQRLQEIQKEVKEIEPQVVAFSGLSGDRTYKKLEKFLTKQIFEIDSVAVEGRGDIQQARKRAAQETEKLLKELEQNANHPQRLEIEVIYKEGRVLVEHEVTAFYKGECCVTEEFDQGIQNVIFRLTQVKTRGKPSLRRARYRTLTKVCAVQEIIDSAKRQPCLPLPAGAHPSVEKINSVMCDVNKAKGTLIAVLMGLNHNETCRHLSCVLTVLLAELDALDVCGHPEIRHYRKEVVDEINRLQKYLDIEEEANSTYAYDLAQNKCILKIEEIRKKMKGIYSYLLQVERGSDLHLKTKAEAQGLIAQLDELSPGKNPCIREARRRAVIEVQTLITFIDLKEALSRRQAHLERWEDETQSHKAVWNILGTLYQILQEVLSFDGNRTDKNYVKLEELLTKQLLALDAIEPKGDEPSKAARKQAVKLAQSILYYLDMKSDEWEP